MNETVKREEFYIDWLPRISEKLQFILLNIKEQREISEEDYDLLRIFHKLWFYGEYPLYRQELNLKEESSVQQGLFADRTTEESGGTKVDEIPVETIKEKKK